MIEIWLAFSAGMAGSFHCIGMCGGIVAALSISGRGTSLRSRTLSQLGYNLGRISTYTLLGVVCAALGSSLDLMAVKSASYWFFVAANLFVMAIGLSSAFGWNGFSLSRLEGKGGAWLARPLKRLISGGSPFSAYPLGLLLGFLPCGLVYAPLVVATASGSPVMGGAIMAALGVGTLPVLLVFGTASSAISGRVRNLMLRLTGLLVFLMGAAGLWRVITRSCPHCTL